ncbi:hypothetical protein [Mesorhizobium sp. M1B.F.Ca.ET.045.04.1.1]|uniref:hypothetical protein n=1 Tax=Mesorhizobium sp. M1B.F.Ca.ET.045.04.1.1 TaxID=2493673 RepID=UPI000F759CFE|nr:hypothetical protein [Mesorhizobium sp. M1B.F.Ca.ET.045.04.1.1]AZO32542.1 hypothetical protein EJ071_38010 [Mesorhizobium sp. M1B.F.Ca.ET.045.04.1.1]
MMNYWRIDPDSRNYCILADDRNDYGSQDFLEMEGARKIDQNKLRFRFDDERPLPISDFVPTFQAGILFAAPSVFERLNRFFSQGRHTFYTAKTDKHDLKIYVPLEERAGFDFLRSSYEKFEDGDIDQVFELKLKAKFSTDVDIFRLKDNFGVRFYIIVSDNFKKMYEAFGFTGLRFTET